MTKEKQWTGIVILLIIGVPLLFAEGIGLLIVIPTLVWAAVLGVPGLVKKFSGD